MGPPIYGVPLASQRLKILGSGPMSKRVDQNLLTAIRRCDRCGDELAKTAAFCPCVERPVPQLPGHGHPFAPGSSSDCGAARRSSDHLGRRRLRDQQHLKERLAASSLPPIISTPSTLYQPTATSPSGPDEPIASFLGYLGDPGVNVLSRHSEAEALAAGHEVCDRLTSGYTFNDVTTQIAEMWVAGGSNDVRRLDDVAQIALAAVYDFCPQFKYELPPKASG